LSLNYKNCGQNNLALLMLAAVVNLVALHARFLKLASVITVSSLRKSSSCTLAPTAVTRRCLWCMESSSNIGCGSRLSRTVLTVGLLRQHPCMYPFPYIWMSSLVELVVYAAFRVAMAACIVTLAPDTQFFRLLP
jgi:hypothetical protein